MTSVEVLIESRAELGESPVWDAETGCLLWADLYAPAIESWRLADGHRQRWVLPETLGSFGRCDDGRLVVAMRSGIHLFEAASGALEFLCCPPGEPLPCWMIVDRGDPQFSGTEDVRRRQVEEEQKFKDWLKEQRRD